MNNQHDKFDPSCITVIIDTREQLPVAFTTFQTIRQSLPTGDYSILGLENEIIVERKEKDDFISCMGLQRERFEKELMRLLAYRSHAIIVGMTNEDLTQGCWRSKISINAVIGTYLGWIEKGARIILAGNRLDEYIEWYLTIAARRRFRQLQGFVKNAS